MEHSSGEQLLLCKTVHGAGLGYGVCTMILKYTCISFQRDGRLILLFKENYASISLKIKKS